MDLQKNKYNTKLVIAEEHEIMSHEDEESQEMKSPDSDTHIIQ